MQIYVFPAGLEDCTFSYSVDRGADGVDIVHPDIVGSTSSGSYSGGGKSNNALVVVET